MAFGSHLGAVAPSRAVHNHAPPQTHHIGGAGDGKWHDQPYTYRSECFVKVRSAVDPLLEYTDFVYHQGVVFMVGSDRSEYKPVGALLHTETAGGYKFDFYQLSKFGAGDSGVGGSGLPGQPGYAEGRGYLKGVYSHSHLVAMRLVAEDYVAAAGSTRISMRVNRKIPTVKPGNAIGLNNNPASIVYDIMTDDWYGAGQSKTDSVDVAWLRRLHDHYGGDLSNLGFDATFNGQSTVAESLQQVAQITGGTAIAKGPVISIAEDGKKQLTQLFNENNIIESSFNITYEFAAKDESDGVLLNYKDADRGRDRSVLLPATANRPQEITLFGCNNEDQAKKYAQLVENRKKFQRTMVKFDVELEGLMANVGDKIAVSHQLPIWGQSLQVVSQLGGVITVSQPIDWAGATALPTVMFRNANGSASPKYQATRISDTSFSVPSPTVDWLTDNDPILCSIGAPTGNQSYQRTFIVQSIDVSGMVCTVSAINVPKDAELYNNTMKYQLNTVI